MLNILLIHVFYFFGLTAGGLLACSAIAGGFGSLEKEPALAKRERLCIWAAEFSGP